MIPDALQGLPFTLGQRLHAQQPIMLVSWERQDWTNGCFDLHYPGGCPLSASPVPGYRVVLDGPHGEYVLRTDIEAERYRLEAAPRIVPFEPAYTWTGGVSGTGETHALCLELLVSAHGRGSIAGCGEPATEIDLAGSAFGSNGFFEHLLTFAPFEHSLFAAATRMETPGATVASEAERRAALTWGQFLALESYVGRSGASWALAIAWSDEAADGCRRVQLEQYGAAYRGGCPDGADDVVFLGDAALERLYAWLDAYAPFEVRNGENEFLSFSGTGTATAPADARKAIHAWLSELAAGG